MVAPVRTSLLRAFSLLAGAVFATGAAAAGRPFPNPLLVAHDGERVRFYEDVIKDRCVLITFAYTRCTGSCPRTTANVLAVQRLLRARGLEIPFVTISLDAEHDTPEVARRYVQRHGSPPAWRYLTGKRDDLESLRVFLGFTDPDPTVDAERSQHLRMVLIGNARADRWVGMPALSRAELIAAAALRTAAEGTAPGGKGTSCATSTRARDERHAARR
jgi:protein SCO1/2